MTICFDGFCGATDCERCYPGCTKRNWIDQRTGELLEEVETVIRFDPPQAVSAGSAGCWWWEIVSFKQREILAGDWAHTHTDAFEIAASTLIRTLENEAVRQWNKLHEDIQ